MMRVPMGPLGNTLAAPFMVMSYKGTSAMATADLLHLLA
jgi:hypothetical protein